MDDNSNLKLNNYTTTQQNDLEIMKITEQFARRFADEWVTDWNNKDLEAIVSHHADDVVFSSPFIIKNQVNS